VNPRAYKAVLVLAAILLLAGSSLCRNGLTRERVALGLTPLPSDPAMPPVLALTTQALGGFRGLIANALWIRANDLQLADKFFEMVQLARWITLLEPRFAQVWIVQAWNMTYNISVKFREAEDRWRWVRHGIELLRDQALRYNPDEASIYRELAWDFQHKMGMNLDDAHFFYKAAWATEMAPLLTEKVTPKFDGHPNFDQLIHPTTEEASNRAAVLRDRYKLDPVLMKELDERYGPLDWRLPEAHAIYWASLGLTKSKPKDLITLRRVIYQSMHQACQHGRLRIAPDGTLYLGPNLDMIPKTDAAYEEMLREETDPPQRDSIKRAQRNFLARAIYDLYIHNRIQDAAKWLGVLRAKFPGSIPDNQPLADFVLSRVMGEVRQSSQANMNSLVEAMVYQSYMQLIEDDDDQAAAYMLRARELFDGYEKAIRGADRLRLTPLEEIKKQVLDQLLDPQSPLSAEARARLRTKLRL
jgi:hypothetical protein